MAAIRRCECGAQLPAARSMRWSPLESARSAPGRARRGRGRSRRSMTVSAGRNRRLAVPQPSTSTRSSSRSRRRPRRAARRLGSVNAHIRPAPAHVGDGLRAWPASAASRSAGARRGRRRARSAPSDSMTSRMRRARTMSVRLPPQVELIRDADGEHVVGHLVDAAAGHHAAHLRLLAERDDVGLRRRAAGRPTRCRSCRRRSAPRP